MDMLKRDAMSKGKQAHIKQQSNLSSPTQDHNVDEILLTLAEEEKEEKPLNGQGSILSEQWEKMERRRKAEKQPCHQGTEAKHNSLNTTLKRE